MIKQQIELMVLEDLKDYSPELSGVIDNFIDQRFDADNLDLSTPQLLDK